MPKTMSVQQFRFESPKTARWICEIRRWYLCIGAFVRRCTIDFFSKEAFVEDVLTENKKVKCLQDGVYKDCLVMKFNPPNDLHMAEQGSNIILRASATYELTNEIGRDMTRIEMENHGMKVDEEWWVYHLRTSRESSSKATPCQWRQNVW